MKKYFLLLGMTISSCSTTQVPPNLKRADMLRGMQKTGQCPGAADRSIKNGKVVALIDVDSEGKAFNIRIIESNPKGVWDESAICLTKLKTFKRNDKGERPPFTDFREELTLKIID